MKIFIHMIRIGLQNMHKGVARKFIFSIFCFSIIVTVGLTILQLILDYHREVKSIHESIAQIEETYLENLINTLWVSDYQVVEIQVSGLLKVKHMQYVAVKEAGKVLVSVGSREKDQVIEKSFDLPYHYGDTTIVLGQLQLQFTLKHLYSDLIHKALFILIFQGIVTFFVSGFSFLLFYHMVGRHLQDMATYIQSLEIEKTSQPFILHGRQKRRPGKSEKMSEDELDLLTLTFNDMQRHLHQSYTVVQEREKTLQKDVERDRSIANISRELLAENWHIQAVLATTLLAAKQVTRSENGFIALLGNERRNTQTRSFSTFFAGEEREEVSGQNAHYIALTDDGTYEGLIGQVLNTRQAFFTNTPHCHDQDMSLFNEEVQIENFLAVPVLIGGSLLGMIALTNAKEGYCGEDLTSMQRIAELFALGAHREMYEAQRKTMEKSLRHLQKNEAIGALAGGIAHDFNNILSPIIGYTELLLDDPQLSLSVGKRLEQILAAAERARDLVKQILTFSREYEKELAPLHPHVIIKEAVRLIQATLPSTIDLQSYIDSSARMIIADPTQIHQVVMNLMTNAYQAIGDKGGTLQVDLFNHTLREPDKEQGLEAGHYVVLQIEDDGLGMDEETQRKIFDPYFTTKPQGKGTGLGLSVVYGIVKNYKGRIFVESEPGTGTVFQVYLPALDAEHDEDIQPQDGVLHHGEERIALVDDEAMIVDIVQQQLANLGYEVEMFTNSEQALRAILAQPDRFDLLITDMTMPNLTGDVLTMEIKKRLPNLPVIICSGYSETLTPERAAFIGVENFLMKPVSQVELARTVRRVLDARKKNVEQCDT